MRGAIPDDDGQPQLHETAGAVAGYSERGIGIQIAVFVEKEDCFRTIVAYMDEQEAGRLHLELTCAILEAQRDRAAAINVLVEASSPGARG